MNNAKEIIRNAKKRALKSPSELHFAHAEKLSGDAYDFSDKDHGEPPYKH